MTVSSIPPEEKAVELSSFFFPETILSIVREGVVSPLPLFSLVKAFVLISIVTFPV